MKQLSTFFGQIIRKIDLDFINLGNRQAINETHIDISNQLGGVVEGLDVYASANGLSLFVNAGTFYNGGLFNPQNGLGGGEKGVIYTPQTITALTPTGLVGTNQTYLLVYAKTVVQNTDPNPNSPNVVYAAKNIQTGENQPVRQYTAGVIVVSNPITKSEIGNFAGVPLALVQTDSNGKIVLIDLTVKRNYTLGGAVDITTGTLVDSAVPDFFLTDRMFANNQISAIKFADSVITSPKLAIYDGSSSNYVNSGTSIVPGSGVGTDHLKTQAVTYSKINYSGSLVDFATRNRLSNSSFEFHPSTITGWTITSGTNFTNTVTIANDPDNAKYGFRAVQLQAGVIAGVMQSAGIEQSVDFQDNLKGKPISAFAYVKPATSFNLSASGTTGIKGKLDFYSDASATAIVKTVEFAGYSGTSTDWYKLQTAAPIIPDFDARSVKVTIYGAFSDRVFVDGVYLGETSILPAWDVSVQEQISLNGLDASAIGTGQFGGNFIAPGAIQTTHIRNADGSVNVNAPVGIQNSQIQPETITGGVGGNIAAGTITSYNLAPGLFLGVPKGAIIMWDDSANLASPGCPPGWTDISDGPSAKMAGRFPLAINTGAGTSIAQPRTKTTAVATGRPSGALGLGAGIVTGAGGAHGHAGHNFGCVCSCGCPNPTPIDGVYDAGDHTHESAVPYYTMRFCQKD